MSEILPKMTAKSWKLWAKKQIDPAFFATRPYMSNTHSFDEELGVYLTFAGKAVTRRLNNVVWDDETQAPAEKTKQQIYVSMVAGPSRIQTHHAPSAAELEALRIINGLVLPSDIVDLLTQTGWDPFKCCNPYLEPQDRKLQPILRDCTSPLYSAHPFHISSNLEPLHCPQTSTSASSFICLPSQTSMTPRPKQVAAVIPKPIIPYSSPVASPPTTVTKPISLASQPVHLKQMSAKTVSSQSEPATVRPPNTSAITQKSAPHAISQSVMASSSKSATKAPPKTSRRTSAKTLIGWKRWAKKQKNTAYSEPAFRASSKAVDEYFGSLSWDGEGKKPADICLQLPYRQLVDQWESFKNRGSPLPASMLEAVRIMNSLVIPAEVVNMLAEAGWDAAKCCNPKLSREEKRLGAEPAELKRSIEDEDESSSQAKKQKTTVTVSHQKRFKAKNSAIEIPVPTDQNSPESSLVIPEVLVKTEEELPMPAIPLSTNSLHVYNAPGEKSENGHLSNYSYQGSNGILRQPSVVPNTSDNVSNSLTVTARLREHSENIEDHSNQLRKYTKKLRRQKSALAQLRHDNQALRECLQEALLPLAQVVNALRKSNKDDKRAFKSAKKRAERGLKEFKSAAKDTEALRQSFEHLRCIIGTVESRHGGKNHSRGQED